MKKDVIYIDIEDDITAVIEKLKNADEKIIALVPPKGNAVLQSIVNLKLLKRAADNAGKRPVLVTSNQALKALAGSLNMYVAKNLQSKPAIPATEDTQAPIEEDEVEVSDGVGQLSSEEAGLKVNADDNEVELTSEEMAALQAENTANETSSKAMKKSSKKNKIPNFDNFRKKLLIGGGVALLLLVLFLVIFGKTKANVVLRAETTPVDASFDLKLNTNGSSDPAHFSLKALTEEQKKTVSQSFTATGQKDLGTKASGTVDFSVKCDDVDQDFSTLPLTIPAGTGVSSNNLTFITQQDVTLSGASDCRFSGSGPVIAQNNGDKYNLDSRSYSVNGYPSVSAEGSQMSGGVSKIVKVITQADVNKAKQQLNQQDNDDVKNELSKAFGEDVKVFDDSFKATLGNINSEPAVGEQANEGKLSAEVTYSLLGVKKDDLKSALTAFITTKMTNPDQQQVYDDGLEGARFEKVSSDQSTAVYKVSARGQFGPKFDIPELKKEIAGKKAGEVRAYLQGLPGVKTIDLHLSPFWANKTPNPDRIQIKLDVDKNIGG